MKVTIKDYNIIKDVVLNFPVGLTLLSGANSSGKTSSLDAIERAIYNDSAVGSNRSYVDSNGSVITTPNLSVEFNLDDGSSIYWQYGKDTKYILTSPTGEVSTYQKLNKETLSQVVNPLKMQELVIDDETIRINFWGQDEGAFLFDKGPTKLFKILAHSPEQDTLDTIINQTRSNIKEWNDSVKSLSVRIDVNKASQASNLAQISALSWLDTFEPKIIKLESLDATIKQLNDFIALYDVVTHSISSTLSRVSQLLPVRNYSISDMESIQLKFNNAKRIIDSYSSIEYSLSTNSSEHTRLSSLVTGLDKAASKIKELDDSKVSISKSIDTINSLIYLDSQMSTLESAKFSINQSINAITTELSTFKICSECGRPL